MLAAYFYVRRNYNVFPPPRSKQPVMFDTTPDRHFATINTILLVASCIVVYITDQMARKEIRWATLLGLATMIVVAAVSLGLTWKEFPSVHWSWGDNAYASICWTTMGLHFIYILAGLGEYALIFTWIATHTMDEKHDLDVTLIGGYWYWVAGIWIPIYLTIWWSPIWLR
jgi:cytochrome c oxidase subunit I+III